MVSHAPALTNAGKNLFIRAAAGEAITFTRFKIGDGTLPAGSTGSELTDLINPLVVFGITSVDDTNEGYLTITGEFSSADVLSDFRLRELGLFVRGEDGVEKLYCYANDGNDAGTLRANASEVASEHAVSLVVAIGEAEHVTAILVSGTLYAKKSDFDRHVGDYNNPHRVTKAHVGLENVPNVTPENQQPTFTVADELSEISSGTKLSVMLGKIAKAIKSLIAHLADTANPHGVTPALIGAATASHEHGASDITSGTLGVSRGGTGQTTMVGLANQLRQSMELLMLEFNNKAVVTDTNLLTVPGIYYAFGDGTCAHFPFTIISGELTNAIIIVYRVQLGSYTYLRQMAFSDSVDRAIEIKRRAEEYPFDHTVWTAWV